MKQHDGRPLPFVHVAHSGTLDVGEGRVLGLPRQRASVERRRAATRDESKGDEGRAREGCHETAPKETGA